MTKLMLSTLMMVVLYSIFSITTAQTMFGSLGSNNTQSPASQNKFKPIIPSSQEYKSAVEARYQQYQQEIATEAKKQLVPSSSLSSKVPGASSGPTTLPTPTQPMPTTPGTMTPPLPTTTTSSPSETYTTSTGSPSQQTSQESIYSGGFKGSDSQSKSPPSKSDNGGGWNINY